MSVNLGQLFYDKGLAVLTKDPKKNNQGPVRIQSK
jgi:hypothetical protein